MQKRACGQKKRKHNITPKIVISTINPTLLFLQDLISRTSLIFEFKVHFRISQPIEDPQNMLKEVLHSSKISNYCLVIESNLADRWDLLDKQNIFLDFDDVVKIS